MTKILLTMPLLESDIARLRSLPGASLEVAASRHKADDLPATMLHDAEVVLCNVPPTNFSELKSLKFLQIGTAGFEHLRPLNLADRDVRVCNARGMFETGIAEWNIAMMVNLRRDLRGMIRNQDRHTWDRDRRFQLEIRGQTVGMWGYGGIGRDTARLAKALGMTVHVMTRSGVKPRHDVYTLPATGDPDGVLPDRVFIKGQEPDFVAGLDFLIVAMPLNRTTDGLIGERELRALPQRAFVLNPARGPIIKETALLQALRDGWIAGAALDTHYAYPLPPEHPLWSFPNVILTPHISGSDQSQHFIPRIGDLCFENSRRYLAGKPLLNELTKDQLRQT